MKSFLVACTCALATGLYLYFYLQGFRFFDNDYDWINQARATSWVSVLTDLMRPVPEDWGFQFRPGQVFVTKMLVALFGETAIAFYAFKCLTAGGVAACIAGFLLVAGESRQTAVLAAAVFGLGAGIAAVTSPSEGPAGASGLSPVPPSCGASGFSASSGVNRQDGLVSLRS